MFTRAYAIAAAAALLLAHATTPAHAFSIVQAGVGAHSVTTCADTFATTAAGGGFQVNSYPCTGGGFNESWSFSGANILGVGTSVPNAAPTCLSVTNGGISAGATVELDACVAGAQNQVWTYLNGNIVSTSTSLCLDRLRARVGDPLVMEICTGTGTQRWVLR